MEYVWKVKVIYLEGKNKVQDSKTLIAKNDMEAREKAWRLICQDYVLLKSKAKLTLLYCETNVVCELDT